MMDFYFFFNVYIMVNVLICIINTAPSQRHEMASDLAPDPTRLH